MPWSIEPEHRGVKRMKDGSNTVSTLMTPATRRKFIVGAAAAGGAFVCAPGVRASQKSHIKSAIRREDTTVRLDLIAATATITWAADDRQFVAVSDGVGLAQSKMTFHSRIFAALGDPPKPSFKDLPSYPDIPWRSASDEAQFWGGSCLALNGRIYQYLMTTNHRYLRSDGSFWPDFRWAGVKLIYSPDDGRTWNNQDGSHPVRWEDWSVRCRNNMIFFNEEPAAAFPSPIWPTFLQMGKNYELNTDGYVYVYAGNGDTEGTADQLILCRVPKSRVLDRHSYEFCTGVLANGDATWTSDIKQRGVVHTFPPGWVSSSKVDGQLPSGWSVSVVYNEPLGVYMMAGQGTGLASNGGWFGKPSYLGLWVSATPWGPFRQIHEESAWMPAADPAARALMPQISPKWISSDGKSFWLVWTDYQFKSAAGEVEHPDKGFNEISRNIVEDAELAAAAAQFYGAYMPCYRFNMQRVDLVVA